MKPEEVMMIRLRKEHAGVPMGTADGYLMRARASILHDFYGGIERIFVRIAQELNDLLVPFRRTPGSPRC